MGNGTLAGKAAVITGAGSGIGKATTLMFLAEGATVAGADLYGDRLAQLRVDAETRGFEPSRLLTLAGDVSDYEFAGSSSKAPSNSSVSWMSWSTMPEGAWASGGLLLST